MLVLYSVSHVSHVSLQEHLRQGTTEAGPLEDWQQEVMEEEELLEDWQREVEEDDIKEDEGSKLPQVNNRKKTSEENIRTKEKKMTSMGLPFLTGISPAGFLSANRKKPGGTDHLVQVRTPLTVVAAGSSFFLGIHTSEHLHARCVQIVPGSSLL